jgi:DUF4097 and DUF4098 domain-containing protein YvlB
MNKIFHVAPVLFTFGLLAAPAWAETERIEKTFPLKSGGTVSVDNVNGDVEIEAWDRDEVQVVATKRGSSREALERVEVRMDARDNAVRISTHYNEQRGWSWRKETGDVDYVIQVPRHAELRDVELVNGALRIQGVKGQVNASTVNGRIEALDLGGDAAIETVNGSIDATFDQVGGKQRIDIESVNGRIELRLPKSADASVDASTVHGRISNDFGIEVDKGEYVGSDMRGKIGSGSARISLETVNGSISVDANN